jgi:hypothetical protein
VKRLDMDAVRAQIAVQNGASEDTEEAEQTA